MKWPLSFISQADFENHVLDTIKNYGKKLDSYDVKKFNSNIIDPIKLIFDKSVYGLSWEEIIKSEIFRQRDKSNNNDIGYFHQNIFKYMDSCEVPPVGWDVIFTPDTEINVGDGVNVSRVFVEMKNKHNTMNSSSSAKTYIKMQAQMNKDDECACFLVEAIAKKSQNIAWTVTVDGDNFKHKRVRRVSMDQFYALITGQEDAFYQMCMILPDVVNKVVSENKGKAVPVDSVFVELEKQVSDNKINFVMALYLLGFNSYNQFKS